ncbi:carboxylesterase family domain-containing protein [Phthorimaea operculella]|nr:carboxylesterase family domain-containing protein [Phthorimaea operculella]
MNKLLCLIGLSLLLVLEVHSTKVEVEEGWLEGSRLELVTKDGFYYSFKGIPYAAPPLGKLRFQAPQPPAHWEGIRNASEHGSICIQADPLAGNKFVPSSEDCLYLNVYTPDLEPKAPLPVMFFIYGGGYSMGSGNADSYGPDFLVPKGVVLVTINYRLEVLGFLSLENEDVPGNAGLKDQNAALKWVKKNIAKFGGDPDNITVFGQSAGAASTVYHMTSPMSRNLFKRAIVMSGVPSCDWNIAFQPRRRAFVLGKQLGFDTRDPNKLLEFLQSVPAEKLAGVNPNLLGSDEASSKVYKMLQFTPVIEKDFKEERFVIEDPEKYLKRNEIIQQEVMIGRTSDEAILKLATLDNIFEIYSQNAELLVPRKILYNISANKTLDISDLVYDHYFGEKAISNSTAKQLLHYISDSAYNYDIHKYIQILSSVNKSKVFVYKFSAVSKRNLYTKMVEKYNITGAGHLDDVVYLFDTKLAKVPVDKNSREYKIIQLMTDLFTNFAKYGNPTPAESNMIWPAYNSSTQSYVEINDTLTLDNGLDNDVAVFWETVLEKGEQ